MSDPTSNVEAIIAQIRQGAKTVREQGDAVSNRVRLFEAWLNKLPGKVSARVCIHSDQFDGVYLALDKFAGEWGLAILEVNFSDPDEPRTVRLLRDSSLEEKISMMKLFPDLLKEIASRQGVLAEQAKVASTNFDDFARRVGMIGGA